MGYFIQRKDEDLMENENLFIIDQFTWSFSRLNSFYNCKYAWFLQYIECNKSANSFFSQFGTLVHKILEKYVKGELSIFEISQYYEDNFDKYVTEPAPPNQYVDLRESYYEKGLDYLNNIDLILDDYEILGVEKEVKFKIKDYDFVGFIDLLLKDKKTGEITILDHKSASIKLTKKGVSKTDIDKFQEFKRQLYLYAKPVLEEYGRVDYLKWNLFKLKDYITIPFNQDEYNEAFQWAEDTIKLIENEIMWLPDNSNRFFCNFLCGQRNNACEYKL